MDAPTAQEARDAVLRLDGHPLDLRIVDRFIDECKPKRKNMPHDEQTELAADVSRDTDYLPVHKDVVADLHKWAEKAEQYLETGTLGPRSYPLFRSLNRHPIPKPIEPPKHERVLALLGDGWGVEFVGDAVVAFIGPANYWRREILVTNPNTPAQIANALRVLAGEAV